MKAVSGEGLKVLAGLEKLGGVAPVTTGEALLVDRLASSGLVRCRRDTATGWLVQELTALGSEQLKLAASRSAGASDMWTRDNFELLIGLGMTPGKAAEALGMDFSTGYKYQKDQELWNKLEGRRSKKAAELCTVGSLWYLDAVNLHTVALVNQANLVVEISKSLKQFIGRPLDDLKEYCKEKGISITTGKRKLKGTGV
jgi:hypothetical protein